MLRFLTLISGPVFAKEMVEITRRPRYYVNRVILGLAVLLALLFVLDTFSWQGRTWGAERQALAHMATTMFKMITVVQQFSIVVFVPVFLSGVITSEREAGSLELLLTTQLSDRDIVVGKLLSRLVTTYVLILSMLPVVCLIMLFGGVSLEQVIKAQVALFTELVFVGAFSIFFSCRSTTVLSSLTRTYWWLAIYVLAIPALILTPMSFISPVPLIFPATLSAISVVNPVGMALALVFENTGFMFTTGRWGTIYFAVAPIVPLTVSAILIWLAVRSLRHHVARRVGPMRRFWAWLIEVFKLGFLKNVLRPTPGQNVRVVENPIWQRSLNAPVYDRDLTLYRIQLAACGFLVVFLMVVAATSFNDLWGEETALVFSGVSWLFVLIVAVILSSTALSGDRLRGFLDIVLTTPLEPLMVFDGTRKSILHHMRIALRMIVALSLFLVIGRPTVFVGVILSATTGMLFLGLLIRVGMVNSLATQRPIIALVWTFMLGACTIVLTLILMEWLGGHEAGVCLLMISLPTWAVSSLWVRRRPGPASVGVYMIAMHFGLITLTSVWEMYYTRRDLPVACYHPIFLGMVSLADRPAFLRSGYPPWPLMYVTYWGALIVNMALVRRFAIRRFDHLVGRIPQDDQIGQRAIRQSLVGRAVEPAG